MRVIAHKAAEKISILRFRGLRPANDSGVADVLRMLAVSQQVIERRRISKCSVLANRCVVVLLVTVGTEGGCVERYKCGAAGLCITHTFDGGMNGGNLIQFAGDKTLLLWCIGVTVVMCLPCSADGRIICRILPIHIKYQIGTGNDFVVIIDKSRVLCSFGRLPCIKERENCVCERRVHSA